VIAIFDESGRVHYLQNLESHSDALEAYNVLSAFLEGARTSSASRTLHYTHDTSFADEFCLFFSAGICIWLATLPTFERVMLDRAMGVCVRTRTNMLGVVCSELVLSLDNLVCAEVCEHDVFVFTQVQRVLEHPERLKEYSLRCAIKLVQTERAFGVMVGVCMQVTSKSDQHRAGRACCRDGCTAIQALVLRSVVPGPTFGVPLRSLLFRIAAGHSGLTAHQVLAGACLALR
jgi:hypothetical protein